MQKLIIEKPYTFIPPHTGNLWPSILQRFIPLYLRKLHGLQKIECKGVDHLRQSIGAGKGIMLTPNHCRPCDPMVVASLSRQVGRHFFTMASRHIFEQSRIQHWLLRRAGAFSIFREGMDREALKTAIEILKSATRPLVIFPEGVITRTNDRLNNLMEGTAFIARSAAKNSAPGNVVVHPIAIRYRYDGLVEETLAPVLQEIETRLTWTQKHGTTLERINSIGNALLTLKELEYLGAAQTGAIKERLAGLTDALLSPLEQEWLKGEATGDVVNRVKKLRTAIVPDLVSGDLAEEEKQRRWQQLTRLYLAQQLSFYPPDYVKSAPTAERLLETVERFEEDLTDKSRIHHPIRACVTIGEAITVPPGRERGVSDPLMEAIRGQIEQMLGLTK